MIFCIFFSLPVKATGEYNLTFNLSSKPGEVNNSNNEYQTVIKVLAERIKVLYYTEHLSFTSRFLLPVLENDEQINLTAVIKLSDHMYFDPVNNKSLSVLPALNNYDVCIFDNINATRLPWHNISEILNQGTGIIVMGLIESPNEMLIKILPIKISNAVIASIKPVQINAHFFKWNPGDELPPFQAINRVNGVQEKAFLIANTEKIPVIAYMPVGPAIVFQINGANPGVLHFLEQGIKQKNFFSDLIPDIIRFVAPTGRNRRLVLSSQNISYRVGEPINFDLQSFDRDFRLAAGGDFYLKQNDERIPFYESSPGNYQATFIADHSGKLTFQAQGLLKEETMTSDPIELHIVMNTGESIEPINHLLLETIAGQTGGEYHPIDRLKDLSISSIDRPRIQRLGLDHPLYYFLIFVLYSCSSYYFCF